MESSGCWNARQARLRRRRKPPSAGRSAVPGSSEVRQRATAGAKFRAPSCASVRPTPPGARYCSAGQGTIRSPAAAKARIRQLFGETARRSQWSRSKHAGSPPAWRPYRFYPRTGLAPGARDGLEVWFQIGSASQRGRNALTPTRRSAARKTPLATASGPQATGRDCVSGYSRRLARELSGGRQRLGKMSGPGRGSAMR
jgi:hypothetical protein